VRDLLDRPEVGTVVLVGSAERDLARLVGALDPLRVSASPVPLTVEGIAEALTGVDVALECFDDSEAPVPGGAHGGAADPELTALRAAMAAKVPFVSATETPETVAAMLSATHGAETVAIVGLSWTPGVSNLLVRAGAEQFDSVTAVRVAWSTSRHDEGADGLHRLRWAWARDPRLVTGGSDGGDRCRVRGERVFFPQPVGWQRVHPVRGAETLSIPRMLPGLDSMIVEGGLSGGPSAILARAAARRTRGLSPPAAALAPRGTGWSALRVDVTGRSAGATRVATYGLVDHLANLEAVPLVVGGLMVVRGEVHARGVVAPEEALEPERFFSLLAERGVRAARLQR